MNRRHFLRTAGLAIAAMGIDPELLIWQPRQMVVVPAHRTVIRISLPSVTWRQLNQGVVPVRPVYRMVG